MEKFYEYRGIIVKIRFHWRRVKSNTCFHQRKYRKNLFEETILVHLRYNVIRFVADGFHVGFLSSSRKSWSPFRYICNALWRIKWMGNICNSETFYQLHVLKHFSDWILGKEILLQQYAIYFSWIYVEKLNRIKKELLIIFRKSTC